MADFLLELFSEEIPARMQRQAAADLARLLAAEIAGAGLKAQAIETFVTPRRVALIARGLPAETEAVSEELKGPRTSAPPQALEGFLRKTGLTQDQLEERDGVYFAVIAKPGRKTADVLAQAVPAVVRAFPWPKSMRWGEASLSTESLRWVRPLKGIVALLGGEVVPFEIAGVASGRTTLGHRFMSSGAIEIADADDYAPKLRAAHVIVSSEERAGIIADTAERLAADAGLQLVADAALAEENAGLTEWPVPLLGRFDPAFLDVPPEVIQLTAAKNQKYFVCRDMAGKLAPAFVCTANIVASDGGASIVAGNQKVLAARLSDARFFWEQDKKKTLESHAAKLSEIVFHEKLGTVADKVERVAKLARWLVEEGIVKGADADLAEQAARLCKADLTTGMVGEFPELQGLMGGYYAREEGLPDAVADAIRDHYKPVGQGDDVPTAPVTVAVSLADKLDSVGAFFGILEEPTGSKDPFALRRSALGSIRYIERGLRFSLKRLFDRHIRHWIDVTYERGLFAYRLELDHSALEQDRIFYKTSPISSPENYEGRFDNELFVALREPVPRDCSFALSDLVGKIAFFLPQPVVFPENAVEFFADRLKVQQREAGVRHDLIDAVFALGGEDDLVRLLARVKALQAFIGTDDGANLLAGYKRAANILKAEAKKGELPSAPDAPTYTPEPAEAALIAALGVAAPKAEAAVAAEDFEGAMAALALLRAPIDAFFEDVTVNDADPDKRAFRLALLERVRAAVHRVADFSRIEG
ncbi:glycine--tRNA ligase subunit beta [Sphingosinicella sp.]|uniref:glycine--tRNA ligase subunit beta n=1 Tax=Sphingosinicella sp. TaxID=1917971 RepID=UPI0017FD885C|nr:glycine--tRNA ligase subunit beta [Sphingosinicella sp.]MBA4757898.1 glycine--tRNA ligase subunit beta [Sphingosinicella sp.]